MTENSPRGARLDHVSDAGDLVFEAGGERFVVTVDDALERAVLAAKQIRMESHGLRQPRANDALPISKIQQLIRAGADPAKVAEHYGLDHALVRRFSASVQMEKQYAIEQFKRVPAPKESRVRTVEDLIHMTLSMAHIDRNTLTWQATRRGHEPWHISATFLASERKVRAEWTWDMHDNTVVCLNPAAKKLLGEQNLGLGDADDRRAALTPIVGPGMGSPSPERSDDSDDMDFPSATGAIGSPVPDPPIAPVPSPAGDAEDTDSPTSLLVPERGDNASKESSEETVRQMTMGDIPVVRADDATAGNGATAKASDAVSGDLPPVPDPSDAGRTDSTSSTGSTNGEGSDAKGDESGARKHRMRRSAIPSWDQILFGE